MMMVFDEMGYCGDPDFLCAPLAHKDGVASQPDVTTEDDYTDEEIDVDELERRLWRDKMRLKRFKEQNKSKEEVDATKQLQSGKKEEDV